LQKLVIDQMFRKIPRNDLSKHIKVLSGMERHSIKTHTTSVFYVMLNTVGIR